MVMEVVHEEEDNTQCTNHPYKNSSPGGICAFCLQEKLGNLVSSSFPLPVFPSSSSSSSPSLRSEFNTKKLPVISTTQSKKNKKDKVTIGTSSDSTSIVFKRCKSTTTPSRGMQFSDEDYSSNNGSHSRGSFWSFLHLSKHSTAKKSDKHFKDLTFTPATPSSIMGSTSSTKKIEDFDDNNNNNNSSPDDETSFDRKVARSRSVGCGNRSFSNDLFERISTGFGDCTLRRVESQREGKVKMHRNGINGQDCIKERVRCGGIFSGFMITPYLVDNNRINRKSITASSNHHLSSKSWGWAFASPMRAFSKPSAAKRDKNATPNLAAIPSLLALSN